MAISITALAMLAAVALPGVAPGTPRTGLPPESPPKTVGCEGGTAGNAWGHAAHVGPFNILGKGHLGAHWSPAARRFTSKVPVVVTGTEPVTVRVPDRLLGRLALIYGASGQDGMSSQITFVPCAKQRATFFPGGMVFTRREPISLLVQPAGWARPTPLNLGKFPPY